MNTDRTKLASWLPDFSENDKRTINKYLMGGLQLGAGVGLITTMLNYMKNLKNRESTADDDDTLYIRKKRNNIQKEASTASNDDSYFAVPVALTGGILASMLSYKAIKSLYNKFRARQAQKELDEAQNIFLDTSGYEKAGSITKSAEETGRGVTMGEVALSAPALLPMLSALATGAVTLHILNKNFPLRKLKPKKPRKIEVIDDQVDDEMQQKQASYDSLLDDGANEYLFRMTLLTKSDDSDLNRLFKTAAIGRLQEFTKTAADIGFLNALDTLKGAENNNVSKDQEELALIAVTKSASVSDCANLLAAVEFFDKNRNICERAAELDEDTQETLYKIAGCLGLAIRHEAAEQLGWLDALGYGIDKTATSLDSLTNLSAGKVADRMVRAIGLRTILSDKDGEEQDIEGSESEEDQDVDKDDNSKALTDLNANIASDTSGEEADIENTNSPSRKKDKVKYISNTKTRRGFLSDISEDDIDKIMTP